MVRVDKSLFLSVYLSEHGLDTWCIPPPRENSPRLSVPFSRLSMGSH
jgi:hypothetical protein